ncbi:zinc-binding dehydrogenase [Algirhabdus cladophorae]|uniref:zinc-binding dehydrogenase n=1 Tax=Algirhabdus cladophorae TaxID=3377108 RepID=UPI003B848D57
MKAAVLYRPNAKILIETLPDPVCPGDGVIVEVKACGVCRSDHHTWVGADPDLRLPHVMGHEFAGVVAEVGPECTKFRKGDRVTAPFILGCGQCADCTTGQPTICDDQRLIGFTQWGAFAQRVPVQAADFNLVHLPDPISFNEAAGMGCRVTTAWRGLNDRAGLKPGEWVVIHGCGGVGLSAVMLAVAIGAQIVAVDVSADALTLAKNLGADICINAAEVADVSEAVRDATGGGAHVAVDALGVTATFDNSLRSLRKLGRHVQIGMPVGMHETVSLPLLDLVYSRQLSLYGMRGLGADGFKTLLDMAVLGQLDLGALVTQTIPLSKVGAALQAMDHSQAAGITVIDNFVS